MVVLADNESTEERKFHDSYMKQVDSDAWEESKSNWKGFCPQMAYTRIRSEWMDGFPVRTEWSLEYVVIDDNDCGQSPILKSSALHVRKLSGK